MQRKFDDVPEEIKKQCVDEIITRVKEIEGPEVGVIAVQDIIDIVTQHYGPGIYNKAVDDAKKLLQDKLSDVAFELDQLEQT